jgi:signal transduction histidine kinase
MNPLERERRRAVILLVLVNALLAVVNAIDINWVWFGFQVPEGFSLKQFVHEGTYALIFSILLSMVVVLWYFRGNQNFYQKDPWLKRLALLWVAQNAVLGISVFLRNWHYMSFHGLAYLRIGVIMFLLLMVVGLITLFLKVKERRTLFYLLRVNTWAAFTVLIGLTTVDWDRLIVRVNLEHSNPGEIDIDNYLAMSDKVLPLLYANLDLVEQQMARHRNNRVRWVDHLEPQAFRDALDAKRDRFMERMRSQHWQEWTWADARTLAALNEQSIIAQR